MTTTIRYEITTNQEDIEKLKRRLEDKKIPFEISENTLTISLENPTRDQISELYHSRITDIEFADIIKLQQKLQSQIQKEFSDILVNYPLISAVEKKVDSLYQNLKVIETPFIKSVNVLGTLGEKFLDFMISELSPVQQQINKNVEKKEEKKEENDSVEDLETPEK
jgi:hypothetical protein